MIVKGESWRSHAQSKAHSSRTHPAESPNRSHEAVVAGAAPLVFTGIPQPQLSAGIPVDHGRLWADHVFTDDGFNPDEPYHAADGRVIQFSAGLMYPSAEETMRCEMDRLTEELEAWGSSLAGEGFEGVDRMEGQCEGKLNDISPSKTHDNAIQKIATQG